MQEFGSSDEERLRDEANAWIARFAPLVMSDSIHTEAEVRARIQSCLELQRHGEALQSRLSAISASDTDLVQTFDQAKGQLESIETDFRRQLARLSPGDPEGIADLEELKDRLAERKARQEIGLQTESSMPGVLEMKVGTGNKPAAMGLGVFGLGWTAFTTFHAVMMIGGMYQAFGLAAFALLAFYSIFFLVGFGMLAAAADAASNEHISLDGRKLTVIKSLGPWVRKKEYILERNAEAVVATMDVGRSGQNRSTRSTPVVQLHDENGAPVGIGANATDVQRNQAAQRINAYLKLHP